MRVFGENLSVFQGEPGFCGILRSIWTWLPPQNIRQIRFKTRPRRVAQGRGRFGDDARSRAGRLTEINNPGGGAMRLKVEAIASAVNP
jgi:hypothetical protein